MRRMSRTSKNVAKERLRLMMEERRGRIDEDILNQIRHEIGGIITKYVDIEPENVEVRVILKNYNKAQGDRMQKNVSKRETYVETI